MNRLEILEKLFDSQIATLVERGIPSQIVDFLANQRTLTTFKASEMTFGDGHIPFLPVIPRTYRSPYDLMSAVFHNGEAGCNHMNPMSITDDFETQFKPYYLYDVENGEATRGKNPKSAENAFEERSPLTVAEVIALTTHTDVLSQHNVWAAGSQYGSNRRIPYIWLVDGNPSLSWGYVNKSDTRYGTPSSGSCNAI